MRPPPRTSCPACERRPRATPTTPTWRPCCATCGGVRRSSHELWETEQAGIWRSHRKRVDHPTVGPLVLDCDTLHVPDWDKAVIVYSAEPGTPEAEALALLRVLGTQDLSTAR